MSSNEDRSVESRRIASAEGEEEEEVREDEMHGFTC